MDMLANTSQLGQFLDFLAHTDLDAGKMGLPHLDRQDHAYAPDSRMDAAILINLMEQATRQSGRDDLMLAFVEWLDPTKLGLFGLIADHCSSIKERHDIEQRYLYLENSAILTETAYPQESNGDILIKLDIQPRLRPNANPFLLALTALHLKMSRLLLGDEWRPKALTLPLSPTMQRLCAQRLRCLNIEQGSHFGITIPYADFHRQMRPSNPVLLGFVENTFKASANRWPRDITALVTSLIQVELRRSAPTLGDIAKRLAMTERTLQRRLKAQGHSYASLLRQVRTDIVQAAFQDVRKRTSDPHARPSLTDLSLQLGYADITTTCRFLNRVSGLPK